MLRLAILSFLLVEGFLIVEAQQNEANLLKNYFENDMVNNCNVIEGKQHGCLDCFICDKDASKRQVLRGKVPRRIKLSDENCQRREFCCYPQSESSARDGNDNCGKSEPNGYPRSTRNSLKSVLQGQYPWRIWIFSEGYTKPLCAGVYINHDKRAIITSATCVENFGPEELRVGFTRDEGNIRIRSDFFIIHDQFDRDTRINDIALFGLFQKDTLSPWAHPACLPSSSPQIATACVAVSDQDIYINSIILGQQSCVVNESKQNQSLLCAVTPIKNDYLPEVGGGLFCEHSMNNFHYVVYGIHLYKPDSFSVYTDISNYTKWIEARIDNIKNQ